MNSFIKLILIAIAAITTPAVINAGDGQHSPVTIPIYNLRNTYYMVGISVGTPAQTFNVTLNTQLANVYLYNESCTFCRDVGYKLYDATQSSTSAPDGRKFELDSFNTFYGIGVLATDKFCFDKSASDPSLCVAKQMLALVTSASQVSGTSLMNGVLGLSPRAQSWYKVATPVDNVREQLPAPWFSVWLRIQQQHSEQLLPGGQLTLGGNDAQHCDQSTFAWTPAIDDVSYNLFATKITLNGQAYGADIVSVSTADSWLTAPTEGYRNQILTQLGAVDVGGGWHTVACNASVTLTFTIGGRPYSLGNRELLKPVINDPALCTISLGGRPSGTGAGGWSLGVPFLHKYCATFDPVGHRVGIAEVINAPATA